LSYRPLPSCEGVQQFCSTSVAYSYVIRPFGHPCCLRQRHELLLGVPNFTFNRLASADRYHQTAHLVDGTGIEPNSLPRNVQFSHP